MTGSSRSLLVCLCLTLALFGCDDSSSAPSTPTSPTTPTTPTPPTTPSSFTVTGTVGEAEPTTNGLTQNVQVHLNGNVSTFTNAQGQFTFSNVAAGTYTLRANRAGFNEGTRTITLPADNGVVVRFLLMPVEGSTTETLEGTISDDTPACHGTSKGCKVYDFGLHYSGEISARLDWTSSDANLDLELRCGDEVLATGEATSSIGEAFTVEEVHSGRKCEVRVLHASGPIQNYTLELTKPN